MVHVVFFCKIWTNHTSYFSSNIPLILLNKSKFSKGELPFLWSLWISRMVRIKTSTKINWMEKWVLRKVVYCFVLLYRETKVGLREPFIIIVRSNFEHSTDHFPTKLYFKNLDVSFQKELGRFRIGKK